MISSLESLKLSFQVAFTATFFSILIGIPFAGLLALKKFPGRKIIDAVITLPVVMPPTVTGYYLLIVFGRHGVLCEPIYNLTGYSLMFSWHAAVLASFIVSVPLMIKTSKTAIEAVDENYVNASYTLGHSTVSTFIRIILPLASKGISAGAVLAFARAIGEFGATLMIAGNIPGKTDTMPIAIYSLVGNGDWSQANYLVLFFTLVSLSFLLIANKLSEKN